MSSNLCAIKKWISQSGLSGLSLGPVVISAMYLFAAAESSSPAEETGDSTTMTWRSRSTWISRHRSMPERSWTTRLRNRGCFRKNEFMIEALMASTSSGFSKPRTQWITWSMFGRRNSLPVGVSGSSDSIPGEAIEREREREFYEVINSVRLC